MKPLKSSATHIALSLLMLIALPQAALAYVGPGAGLTLLGALFGVLAAVVLAVAGVILWPLRAMRARRRQAQQASADHQPPVTQ